MLGLLSRYISSSIIMQRLTKKYYDTQDDVGPLIGIVHNESTATMQSYFWEGDETN